MSDDIQIEQVALSEPHVMPVNVEGRTQEPWIDVAIGVRNRSPSQTYYIMASLRALKYDSETRTLTLSCAEPSRGLSMRQITVPKVLPILPEESVTFSISVPLRLKVLPVGKRLGSAVDVIDISDLERVVCSVQYGGVPFHSTAGTADEMSRDLVMWGERAQETFRVNVEEAEDGVSEAGETEHRERAHPSGNGESEKRGRANGERG